MIGIFDSGVGGMTVARAVEKALPEYRLIYFGDLARSPYGSKSPEAIAEYSRQNTDFLLSHGARMIIIACNSAASVTFGQCDKETDVPVFEVISPAVKKAVASTQSGRIGVIGTRATVRSGIYEKKIAWLAPQAQVFSQACPLLVPLVEEGWLGRRETKMILRRYLHPLRLQMVDTLVLACTHYPLLKTMIQSRIGKRVTIIDSAEEVATGLKNYISDNQALAAQLTRGGENLFYASDVTEAAKATARMIFGREINLIKTHVS